MHPFRLAKSGDLDALLALQRTYYTEVGYAFDPARARAALATLLADPALGAVWIAEDAGAAVAYAVLTLGYSLEYGGRDAFLDELYVAPAQRRRGLARAALAALEAGARAAGVRELHLEVEQELAGARALYRRAGFADHDRVLMSKPVSRAPRRG
jgi:ribosomal protein S18 acetylase RimI-like enzyme